MPHFSKQQNFQRYREDKFRFDVDDHWSEEPSVAAAEDNSRRRRKPKFRLSFQTANCRVFNLYFIGRPQPTCEPVN